jgi:hypothetical protein
MAAIPTFAGNPQSLTDGLNQLINAINSAPGGANSAAGLPISQGGTGATTAAAALTALGASSATVAAFTSGSITGLTNLTTLIATISNPAGQGTLAVNSQQASGFGGFIKLQSAGGNQAYVGLDSGINGGTNYGQLTLQTVSGNINLQPTGGLVLVNTTTLIGSSVALTNGAAAQAATLTNGPVAGNPTKWIPISDNGTTRYIPAW